MAPESSTVQRPSQLNPVLPFFQEFVPDPSLVFLFLLPKCPSISIVLSSAPGILLQHEFHWADPPSPLWIQEAFSFDLVFSQLHLTPYLFNFLDLQPRLVVAIPTIKLNHETYLHHYWWWTCSFLFSKCVVRLSRREIELCLDYVSYWYCLDQRYGF